MRRALNSGSTDVHADPTVLDRDEVTDGARGGVVEPQRFSHGQTLTTLDFRSDQSTQRVTALKATWLTARRSLADMFISDPVYRLVLMMTSLTSVYTL